MAVNFFTKKIITRKWSIFLYVLKNKKDRSGYFTYTCKFLKEYVCK
jgi:hypothetical protein